MRVDMSTSCMYSFYMFTFKFKRIALKGMALLDQLSPAELCASLPVGPDYSRGFRVEYVGELSSPEQGIMCIANGEGYSAFLTAPMDYFGSEDFEAAFNALVSSELDTLSIVEHARELIPA